MYEERKKKQLLKTHMQQTLLVFPKPRESQWKLKCYLIALLLSLSLFYLFIIFLKKLSFFSLSLIINLKEYLNGIEMAYLNKKVRNCLIFFSFFFKKKKLKKYAASTYISS
jgi:hypothetical protein